MPTKTKKLEATVDTVKAATAPHRHNYSPPNNELENAGSIEFEVRI